MAKHTGVPDAEAANRGWENVYREQGLESLWTEEPIPIAETSAEFLRGQGVRTAVDLGCGDGRNLPPLLRRGISVTGVDASPTATRRAVSRLRQLGLGGFVVRSDAVSMPFADESLDAITCFDVFSHFVDPAGALAECERVLHRGGWLVANAFSCDDSEYGRGEEIAPDTFMYRGTMFRFYREAELRELCRSWQLVELETEAWDDPPHGDYRPYPHRHSAFRFRMRKL